VTFVETPASQALVNLYLSCIGAKGFPVSLLRGFVERKVRASGTVIAVPVEFRFSAMRVFGGTVFYSGIVSKGYVEKLIKLKAHVTPACTDFLVKEGNKLVEVACGWERPLLVICQFPTRALYRSYESLVDLLVSVAKYKYSGSVSEPYLPSKVLVDLLYKKIPEAGYPFNLVACSNSSDVEECSADALLVSLDEYIATLLYAVNTRALHPHARAVSTGRIETGVVELGVTKSKEGSL